MMQLRGVFVALGLSVAVLLPQSAGSMDVGIAVTPAKLEVSIPAGATYNLPITVQNSSGDPAHVQASLVDFGVGLSGEYRFMRVGSGPYSLLRWAAIRPREFDVPQGTTQQVQLTISIPQQSGLSGEYGGIVFFQTRPSRSNARNGVVFSVRVASKIYETIPGTAKLDGAIAKMSAASSSKGESYRVLFKNTGNTHVYLHGQLSVQRGNSVVEQVQLGNDELVERGGQRLLQVFGRRLEPGSYQAVATLDYGGKTETGGEIAFDVH